MSSAIRFIQGAFGRIALLEMDGPLVMHAHHHSHVLIKTGGVDAAFEVRGIRCLLTDMQAVLVNAWEPHAYLHHHQAASSTEILALYIEPAWLAQAGPARDVAGAAHIFTQPTVSPTARARQLAQEMAGLLRDAAGGGITHFENLLAEMMISVIEPFLPACNPWRLFRQAAYSPQDARIRRAMALMREHVGSGMEMGKVAAHCGLSRAHFFELFRRTTHMTPAIFTNALRMEAAFDRLAGAPEPIAGIAGRLGFSAPGHFTRFFRGHIGVTPRAYRQAVIAAPQ